MVKGQTFIIVQARMNSERLPGKAMKLIDGNPMIGIMFTRLRASDYPIILATSTNPENDILCDYAQSEGVFLFRGSEENVLERYYNAANEYDAKKIIRVTGDNPLVDGVFMKDTLKELNDHSNRIYFSPGRSHTWPVGVTFEYFSYELLEEAYLNASLKGQREHVTPYMHQNIPGDIEIQTIYNKSKKNSYRLTVDTKEDFSLLKILIEKYKCHLMSIKEIIKLLDTHPELVKLNSTIKLKDWML